MEKLAKTTHYGNAQSHIVGNGSIMEQHGPQACGGASAALTHFHTTTETFVGLASHRKLGAGRKEKGRGARMFAMLQNLRLVQTLMLEMPNRHKAFLAASHCCQGLALAYSVVLAKHIASTRWTS